MGTRAILGGPLALRASKRAIIFGLFGNDHVSNRERFPLGNGKDENFSPIVLSRNLSRITGRKTFYNFGRFWQRFEFLENIFRIQRTSQKLVRTVSYRWPKYRLGNERKRQSMAESSVGEIAMGTITWNTDVNASGCPGEIVNDDGRTLLIQTDWDYPGVAQTFGWTLREVQKLQDDYEETPICEHDSTDGTVDCKQCGCTASDFISAARDWLVDNDGAEADDPGYFLDE